MYIKNGELLTGFMDKENLGPGPGGLVHVIWMEFGPDRCREFINNCQFTINHWLLQNGMSIGERQGCCSALSLK